MSAELVLALLLVILTLFIAGVVLIITAPRAKSPEDNLRQLRNELRKNRRL